LGPADWKLKEAEMADIFISDRLNQTVHQLRGIWRDITAGGWPRKTQPLDPDLPPAALSELRDQIATCLEARGGIVSARMRSAELGSTYLDLSPIGRERFLTLLADEFGVCTDALETAINAYQAPQANRAAVEDRLREVLVSPRIQLMTRFNDMREGIKFLVDLRCDLLALDSDNVNLPTFDSELRRLLKSWFDVGFLELRRINWDSPAALLEKLIAYEAVHEIESWSDLRNRLDRDRCCYAFFHPNMPQEPLIFVEVALMGGIADNIQTLLDATAPQLDPGAAETAIFYSISNTQKGLRGISFGNFLIKRVVDDLSARFPRLKNFVTLSPLPGFRKWLATLPADGFETILGQSQREALQKRSGAATPASLSPILDSLDPALSEPLKQLGIYYLTEAKRNGKPVDPVARFHLGNGASIEQINWPANASANGIAQAAGLMVNYRYRLGEIEKNHEQFAESGHIAVSPAVKRLMRK
jgi:malonyl-CoA decarboxylase